MSDERGHDGREDVQDLRQRLGVVLRLHRRLRQAERADEGGFTIIEVMVATSILLVVLAMVFGSLVSLTRSEDRSQRLVSNEQNVRFELDQLAREIRAANPLVPLLNATSAATYDNQIEMVLGPTGGTQQVVRWTYDTDDAADGPSGHERDVQHRDGRLPVVLPDPRAQR